MRRKPITINKIIDPDYLSKTYLYIRKLLAKDSTYAIHFNHDISLQVNVNETDRYIIDQV